ncbi:hypothetical protein TeGR_g1554, partial [Tetraparma gracilis]
MDGFSALNSSQKQLVAKTVAERAGVFTVAASSKAAANDKSAAADSSSDSDATRLEPSTKPGRERVFDSSSDDSDAPEPPPPARAPRKRSVPRAMTPAQQRRAADAARQRAPALPPARVAKGVSMSPHSETSSSDSDSPSSPPSSKRSRAAAPPPAPRPNPRYGLLANGGAGEPGPARG